jgi:Bacitracin resistance protein BacA
MTLLQSIILGVVEGFTEFLPISSTGHLILASRLLGLAQTEFQKSFEIAIQLGAIASVIVLYWRKFLEPAVLTRVITAFIPTGIIGFALYHVVKTYLFGSDTIVLWALGLGGVALIVFELLHREADDAIADVESISYTKAALIGLFQSISIIPGGPGRERPSSAASFSACRAAPSWSSPFCSPFRPCSPPRVTTFSRMRRPSRQTSSVCLPQASSRRFLSLCSALNSCWPSCAPTPSFPLVFIASWSPSPSPFCERRERQRLRVDRWRAYLDRRLA